MVEGINTQKRRYTQEIDHSLSPTHFYKPTTSSSTIIHFFSHLATVLYVLLCIIHILDTTIHIPTSPTQATTLLAFNLNKYTQEHGVGSIFSIILILYLLIITCNHLDIIIVESFRLGIVPPAVFTLSRGFSAPPIVHVYLFFCTCRSL